MELFLCVLMQIVGGCIAASFFIPLQRVQHWSWEVNWLVFATIAWLLLPWGLSGLLIPNLVEVLRHIPAWTMGWLLFFGMCWGFAWLAYTWAIAGLGFMMGTILTLGAVTLYGVVFPALFFGESTELINLTSGEIIQLGLVLLVLGMATCLAAVYIRERNRSGVHSSSPVTQGMIAAMFAGMFSTGFTMGMGFGEPVNKLALVAGALPVWRDFPLVLVLLTGGYVAMALLCAFRWILRKKSEDEGAEEEQPASANFLYILTAGVMWCTAFYSSLMGWRMQGAPEYSALNIPVICMALAGIFWGVQLSEWSNTNRRALWALYSGIVLTVLAWIVVGGAQYLSRLGM